MGGFFSVMSSSGEGSPESNKYGDLDLDKSLDQMIKSKRSRSRSRERGRDRSTPYDRPDRRRSRSQSYSPRRREGCRVYVGNIAWETTWQDLKDHMKSVGHVEYASIFQNGNLSKGCGVVEFSSPDGAKRAIEELNDTKIKGSDRLIFVREDREHDSHSRDRRDRDRDRDRNRDRDYRDRDRDRNRDRDRDRDRYPRRDERRGDREGRQLFVENLPYSTKWFDLKDHFKAFGHVIKADIIHGNDGRSAGRGTVLFESASDMKRAIEETNEQDFQGRKIFVKEDRYA